jgi:2-keto-4-pentenoate hydratase/2-oxohepta-3-ene-1,7-dioic acid hydratase in catechol pathway
VRAPTKIVCVGRNYAAHARELGNDVPAQPLIFLKPPSSVIGDGDTIVLPPDSKRVEYEGEIGLVIGVRARNVSESEALAIVSAYVPVNDVTARDLQKSDSQWTRAKGFDTFCPIGAAVPARGIDWHDLEVACRVNGQERQRGNARMMAFGIPFIIAYISHIMTLEPGDVIATGTPEGVGPLVPGDVVEVELVGRSVLRNVVTDSQV